MLKRSTCRVSKRWPSYIRCVANETFADLCCILILYAQFEGDKKARSDAEAKRIESKGKKDLLETALKRYKTLDIMGGVFDDEDGKDRITKLFIQF